MTSLLHHDHPAISDEEAVSYIHETGPWSRFLLTPWPVQSLLEGTAMVGVSIWAGVAIGLDHAWAGLGVGVLGVALAILVAAPGAYTESHRAYADRYFAALRVHNDHDVRAHPYLFLLVAPVLGAVVGALGGRHSGAETFEMRVIGAVVGGVAGLVYALVRIRRARQLPLS